MSQDFQIHGGASPVHATTDDGRPFLVNVPGSKLWYVATATGFALCSENLIVPELSRHWPELEVSRPTDSGSRPLSLQELFRRYGRRADRVIYEYGGTTRYDYGEEHGGDLCIGIHTPRGPAHSSPRVEEWLRLFFDRQLDAGLDWIATINRTDRPTCVLIARGEPDAGKGMLGTALSTVMGGFVKYTEIMGRFNDGLLHSPFVWLDEASPVVQGARSEIFRDLFSNEEHRIEAKHRPLVTLRGCPRLYVSTNNNDPLKLSDDHFGWTDERAIGRRIRIVRVGNDAAVYLRSLGGRTGTEGWCDRDGELTCHLRWLIATRGPLVEVGPRLLVEGDADQWTASIATREGVPGQVAEAIRVWLELQDEAQQSDNVHHLFGDKAPCRRLPDYPGVLMVSADLLQRSWPHLGGGSERPPSLRAMGSALQRLSGCPKPIRVLLPSGQRKRLYPVPLQSLGEP